MNCVLDEKKRRLFIIQNKQDENDSERAEYKSCFILGAHSHRRHLT